MVLHVGKVLVAALALLGLTVGCGNPQAPTAPGGSAQASGSTEKPSNGDASGSETPPAGDTEPEWMQRARTQAREHGAALNYKAREQGSALYDRSKDEISKQSDRLVTYTKEQYRELLEASRKEVQEALNAAGRTADGGLNYLLPVPEPKNQAFEKGKQFAITHLPVIRALARYKKAHIAWAAAHLIANQEEAEKARALAKRECLLAVLEGGLDLTVLGTGGMTDAAAKAGQKSLSVLRKGQASGVYQDETTVTALDVFLVTALKVPAIDAVTTELLSVDLPKLGDTVIGTK